MNDYRNLQYLPPILLFLEKIDIRFLLEPISGNFSLPGLQTRNGILVIDTTQLLYPGDVLHEAGHIALAPVAVRSQINTPIFGQLDFDKATHEMMVLAWSYAAALESGTPPGVLFHPDGYKGQHEGIIYGFRSGQHIGLPMLQWLGMAYDVQNAVLHNEQPFPHMIQWLRPAAPTI